jgi:hypothetical protein
MHSSPCPSARARIRRSPRPYYPQRDPIVPPKYGPDTAHLLRNIAGIPDFPGRCREIGGSTCPAPRAPSPVAGLSSRPSEPIGLAPKARSRASSTRYGRDRVNTGRTGFAPGGVYWIPALGPEALGRNDARECSRVPLTNARKYPPPPSPPDRAAPAQAGTGSTPPPCRSAPPAPASRRASPAARADAARPTRRRRPARR